MSRAQKLLSNLVEKDNKTVKENMETMDGLGSYLFGEFEAEDEKNQKKVDKIVDQMIKLYNELNKYIEG